MKVREKMIEKVISVQHDDSVKQALELLLEHKFSGLPVVDKENKLVGVFTEKDIIQYILPGYLKKVGIFVYEDDPKAIKNKVKELLQERKVSDVMQEEVISIDADASLSEAARTILTEKIRRIPVVDKERKVVGIITRQDIVKAFVAE